MSHGSLTPKNWYWVRRDDGSLAPYRLHRVRKDSGSGTMIGEFFVGSFIQTFPLSRVEGEAQMPRQTSCGSKLEFPHES